MAGDLSRRGVLAAGAMAGGGGMRRLDQRLVGTSRAGSGPAPQNVFLVNPVIVVTPGHGMFVYSGTPAAGNLIASIAATAGTDPYGNAYKVGVSSYLPGTSFSELSAGNVILGSLNAASTIISGAELSIGDATVASAAPSLIVQSPLTSAAVVAALSLFGQSQDNSKLAQAVLAAGPSSGVTAAMLEIHGATGQTCLVLIADAAATIGTGIRVTGDAHNRLNINANGDHSWGNGTLVTDTGLLRLSANLMGFTTTDVAVHTAGRGLQVAEGANAKQGTATLAAGTILVNNTSVTASSRIFPAAQDNNTTGALRISARVAGTSFTITSSNAADSGVVAYEMFEPG